MRRASSQPIPASMIVRPARRASSSGGTTRSRGCGPAILFLAYATIARASSSVSSVYSCTRLRSGHERLAELAERLDVRVDVVIGVLHGDRPLLLVAGRHEDAAVDHPRVRGPVQVGHRLEE